MSYTALYSPLYSLERNGQKGARILDINQWRDYQTQSGIFGTLVGKSVTDMQIVGSDYPRAEYKVLYGFRTYTREAPDYYLGKSTSTLGCNFNLERIGYWYDRSEFLNLWETLSEILEPFYFYHPAPEHGLEEHGRELIEESPVSIAKVTGEDGDITVEEFDIGVIGVEDESTD